MYYIYFLHYKKSPMDHEEALSQLPDEIIRNALKEIIRKSTKTDKYSIKVESGSSKGDNYIGVVYRVIVKFHSALNNNSINGSEKKDENELSIILKLPPQNAIRRKQFFARSTFVREAMMYDEVLPLLMTFQESKGIDLGKDGFYEIPKCLGTITEDGFEAIFLDDLRPKGFQMFNRLEKVTVEHVKLIMTTLGRFHAVSFAFKDQCPQAMSKYKLIEDIFEARKEDDTLSAYCDTLKQRALDSLREETDQIVIDKVNQLFEGERFFTLLLDLVCGKDAEPYAIICHGDCWNNNILFKYENGHPVEVRLIDWQISRYASPVTDLMYYLFTCTTKELRDAHYNQLINIYHEQLSKTLTKLGSDPEKVFPRHALDDQLKKFGKWGLLMGMMLLPIITSYAEDIPDLDELSEQLDAGNLDTETAFKPKQTFAVYQERMRSVAIDMVRLGYL